MSISFATMVENDMSTTMLQSTHELRNDGGCDTTTMALWRNHELHNNGKHNMT